MKKRKFKETQGKFTLFDLMSAFKDHLKEFVNQPTDENLQKFLRVAQNYKDGWIKMVAEKDGLGSVKPSKVLTEAFISDQGNKRDGKQEELDALSASDFEISADQQYDIKQDGLEIEIKKRFHHGDGSWYSKENPTEHLSKNKIERVVKTELDRAESPDKNTKFLTYAIYVPKVILQGDGLKVPEQDYIQHSVRARRELHGDQSKRLNRRWYFEQGKDGKDGQRLAWWCSREQFTKLIEKVNEGKMFRKELDDKRLDDSMISYTFSRDLTVQEREDLIKEFTLEHERKELRQEGYYFCIAETHYPKALSQMTDRKFYENRSLWRDILIISPTKITVRSTTNDRYYKPSEKIPDSGWVISNDMTSIPNQVARYFASYVISGFKTNE